MSPTAPWIAVVDDDPLVCDMLLTLLAGSGMQGLSAGNWPELQALMERGRPALILLDVGLPGVDGFTIMRWLRAMDSDGPPVIMLTGATGRGDRIAGLDLGADDYVCKPFDADELLSRIRVVLRRARVRTPVPEPVTDGDIAFGHWLLKTRERVVMNLIERRIADLTAMEFDLLLTMASHPNRIFTRDELLKLAHDRAPEPFDRSIDVRITRLRKKLEVKPDNPQFIRTIRGKGYMFLSRKT